MSTASVNSPESAALPEPVQWAAWTMLGLAALFALARLLRGPATPDRIVAVDLLASLVMAALLLGGISTGDPFAIQAVLGFAVVLFLGTAALSRYLEDTGNHDKS